MPDIREVLEQAAPPVSEVDVDRVRRDARRRRAVPRVLAGSVAAAALVVGVLVVTQGDDGPGRITSGTAPDTTTSTSEAPTTTTAPATTVAPTTTAPPPTVPVGEDRLSTESRLGYAGLGPIKLGMNFDDAVAAAHVTPQPDPVCDVTLRGEPDSGVEFIAVWGRPVIETITIGRPGLRTISGIQVGSTRAEVLAAYPFAEFGNAPYSPPSPEYLAITGPAGQVIQFGFDADDRVAYMQLAVSREKMDGYAVC